MSNYIFTQQQMTTLANNIRSLTGSSETLNISEMQDEVKDSIDTLIIPTGTTSISANYLANWPNVTGIKIPSSVTNIYANAFKNCTNLVTIELPSTKINIRDDAFTGCTSVRNIIGHFDNVKTVASQASPNDHYSVKILSAIDNTITEWIYGDDQLQKIEIEEGITTLSSAFNNCLNLYEVYLPNSINKFISTNFYTSIYDNTLKYNILNGQKYLGSKNQPWLVLIDAQESTSQYTGACKIIGTGLPINWRDKTLYLNSATIGISDQALSNSIQLNNIPDLSYNTTLKYADFSYTGFSSLTLPSSIEKVKLQFMDKLERLSMSETIMTSFDFNDLYPCKALIDLTLPNHYLEEIYLTELDRPNLYITLPNTVKTISGHTDVHIFVSNSSYFQGDAEHMNFLIKKRDGELWINELVWIRSYPNLTIQVPEGVTSLGPGVAYGLEDLNLILPSTLTTFGYQCFWNTAFSGTLTIPEGITAINRNYFHNTYIPILSLPSTLTTLAENSLSGAHIDSIVVDSNNTKFTCTADNKCLIENGSTIRYLCEGGSIPETGSITSIAKFAISKDVTYIKIPNSITSINSVPFANYDRIYEVYNLSNVSWPGVTAVDVYSDISDKHIVRNNHFITIEQNNTNILLGYENVNATSITIPSGIDEIAANAFSQFDRLTTLVIPNTVSQINSYCVYCSPYYRKQVTFNLTIPFLGQNVNDTQTSLGSLFYLGLQGSSKQIVNITLNGGEIWNAFHGLSPTSLVINDAIDIHDSITSSISQLKTLTINCNGLEGRLISSYSLPKLESIIIGSGVTSLGDNLLKGLSIQSITLPNTLTSIGESTFEGCTFDSFTFPSNLQSIGDNAFKNSNLKGTITLPNTVTTLGEGCFDSNKIAEIILSSNLTSIPNNCFRNNLLHDVVILDSVISIGTNAFANNYIYKITLGTNLDIESLDFLDASKLIEVYNKSSFVIDTEVYTSIKNIYTENSGGTKLYIADNIVYYSTDGTEFGIKIIVYDLAPSTHMQLTVLNDTTEFWPTFSSYPSHPHMGITNLICQAYLDVNEVMFFPNLKIVTAQYIDNISSAIRFTQLPLEVFNALYPATSIWIPGYDKEVSILSVPNSATDVTLGESTETILYNGTMAQWKLLTLNGAVGADASGNYPIAYCLDGQIYVGLDN